MGSDPLNSAALTENVKVSKMEDNPPIHTLYIHNLNDKIKPDRLKQSLYASFSQFGKVLEIAIFKARFLRGQAWITFDDVPSASNALRSMNNTTIFGKNMIVQFAKQESDVIARRNGTFVPREKQSRDVPHSSKSDEEMRERKRSMAPPPPPPRQSQHLPHHILFLQDLPPSCNQDMLRVLFEQYHGYKVRFYCSVDACGLY